MKKILVLILVILSISSTGCSNKNNNDLITQGKDALENYKFKEAREFLSQVLDIEKNNEHARAMYFQSIRFEKAIKYEHQGNYKKAIEELDIGEKIKNGSQIIKVDLSNKKKELIKLNEEYIKSQEERKENAKIEAGKDRYRVESIAKKENQIILEEKRKEEEIKNKQQEKLKENEEIIKNETEMDKTPVDNTIKPPVIQDENQI